MKNGAMASPIARQLRSLRKRAGMTQQELGLACGWSGQSVIGNYESLSDSARQPNASQLVTLADTLGVPVSELFNADERGSQSQRIDFGKMSMATKALLDFVELTGRPLDWATRPELLEVAYQVVDSYGPIPGDSIDLTKELARRIRGEHGGGKGAAAAVAGRRVGDTPGGEDQ